MKNDILRKDTAKQMRVIHGAILKGHMSIEEEKDEFNFAPMVWGGMVLFGIMFWIVMFSLFAPKVHAQEFTDMQIVNAIYMAEGGSHAQFQFGIRSIKCTEYSTCRQICITTVKHNRRRYQRYGSKTSSNFIEFLGNRYCPIKGRISRAEKRLNKNWIKNVKYFLRKELRCK